MTKNILFTGNMKLWCEIHDSLNGKYNLAYFSKPVDALNYTSDMDLAIFQNSNFDLISEMRKKYPKLEIVLMEEDFKKRTQEKYMEIGIVFLPTTNGLIHKINSYLEPVANNPNNRVVRKKVTHTHGYNKSSGKSKK